jgi:outer membrane biogenesis lipoprotein LolB
MRFKPQGKPLKKAVLPVVFFTLYACSAQTPLSPSSLSSDSYPLINGPQSAVVTYKSKDHSDQADI